MMESVQALVREHDVALAELAGHLENLLDRFGNRALGGTLVLPWPTIPTA